MTLVNKVAVETVPYPMAVLVIQNAMAVFMLECGAKLAPNAIGQTPKFDCRIVKRWLPLVVLFLTMLVSSPCARMHVSAVTLVVLRNLSSLMVAFGDRIFIGTAMSLDVSLCMVGMLIGATLSGIADVAFTRTGYVWLFVNALSTRAYQIYIKVLVKDTHIKKLKAVGMSYYNNVISLPFLLILSLANGEVYEVVSRRLSLINMKSLTVMALSGMIGFLASTTAFALNTRISATSLMVLNNANKFLVIIFSELVIARILGPPSFTGAVVVIAFGFAYANVDRWVTAVSEEKDGEQADHRAKMWPWALSFARALTGAFLLLLTWVGRIQRQSQGNRE